MFHSKDCGTAYRGCAPDCPKDKMEKGTHAFNRTEMMNVMIKVKDDAEAPLRLEIERLRNELAYKELELANEKTISHQMITRLTEKIVALEVEKRMEVVCPTNKP